MRRLLTPKFSFLVGTFCTVLCGAVSATSATNGASGSAKVIERTFSGLGGRSAVSDIQTIFDGIAARNLSRGQLLLSGSVDAATLAAVISQLKVTTEFMNVGGFEFEDDTLTRLANRVLAPDGAIPLRTIELESDRGLDRLTDIIALSGIATPLLSSELPAGLKFRQVGGFDESPVTQSGIEAGSLGRSGAAYSSAVDHLGTEANSSPVSKVYGDIPASNNTIGSLENPVVKTSNGHLAAALPAFNPAPVTFSNSFSGGSFALGNAVTALLSAPLVFGSDQPLTGNRTIAGGVIAAGLVSPGNSPGVINISGDFTLLNTSILLIELAGKASGEFDVLNVSGNVTLGGSQLNLRLLNNFQSSALPTDRFSVVLAGGVLSGVFGNVQNGQRLSTLDGISSFQVNYGPNSAFANTIGPNTVVLSNFAAVPEPSTWVLMSTGSLFVAFILRRRKS